MQRGAAAKSFLIHKWPEYCHNNKQPEAKIAAPLKA